MKTGLADLHAVGIRCPDQGCAQDPACTDLDAYAEHRFQRHQVVSSVAVREWDQAVRSARAVATAPAAPAWPAPTNVARQSGAKEASMSTPPPMSEWTCGHCGEKGHRRDHCPDKNRPGIPASIRCGYCKRRDGTHAPKCRRRPGTAQNGPTKPALASAKPGRPARRGRPPSAATPAPSAPWAILPGLREARATCEAWAAKWMRAAESLRELEADAEGRRER